MSRKLGDIESTEICILHMQVLLNKVTYKLKDNTLTGLETKVTGRIPLVE
jgi:hypothetical protein